MFILLILCGVTKLILADYEDAGMLLFFVFVIIGITVYQERKTERALDALRDLRSEYSPISVQSGHTICDSL